MKPADNINNLFENSKITVGENVDKKILNKAASALPRQAAQTNRNIWSIIMHSKITKLSTAAAAILLVIIITIINHTTPKAWAIEQTIDAFKDIQTVKLECYGTGFGKYDGYIRRTGDDWTLFQCLGEKADGKLFGLLEGYMYYWYEPGSRVIYQQDFSKGGFSGSCASKLYGEAVKMAPAILPYAKTLFQTFKTLASEWKETYKVDEQTGRDSVFVTCTYEPLLMSFEGVFDVETKLVIRGKAWQNSNFQGEPDFVVHNITYNIEIPDERFDFEKRFGVPIMLYTQWKPACDLFDKAHQLREKQPEEAIKVYWELYQKYPNHFQTSHALNNIGVIYYDQKDYGKALTYFQKVIDEYPYPNWRVSDAYIYMGYCYKEMNQPAKAVEAFEKGLEIIKSWSDEEINHKFVEDLENTIKELKESL